MEDLTNEQLDKATAPGAPAVQTTTIDSPKAPVFNGQYFPNAVVRVFTTPDPSNENRLIKATKRFDLVTRLVLDRVNGMGSANKTGEKYITLIGQYAPFKTLRITASSQNADAVISMLHNNVEGKDKEFALKEKLVVEVVGTPMKGMGFNVDELYLVQKDGTKKVIIAAPTQTAEAEVEAAIF